MSLRTTAVLLAILAVLGAGVYFLEYRPNPEGPSILDTNLQIWKLDDKTVQKVVARAGDQQQTMVKRPDGLWYLEPQDLRADYWRISGTLIRLANMRASRKVTDNPRDLATYGLETPQVALTLGDPNGVDYTLLIGGKTPNDGGFYAKTPDSPTIWVVGTFNIEDIERFVKEPAFEPTPSTTNTPSTAATGTPGPSGASGTPTPGPAGSAPGLPTLGVATATP